MNKNLIFLVCFLLAACAPATAVTVNGQPADPFMMVDQARGTAEAAQAEAEFYGGKLTATAQAPIVAITQTSAAMAFERTQVAVDYTSTAMGWTQTPVPTATPNAAATLEMARVQSAATKIANESALSDLQVQRAQSVNQIKAMSWYVVGLVFLVAGLMFAVTWAKRFAMISTPIDENTGKPLPMLNVVDGSWSDIDRAVNGSVSISRGFVKALPAITAERQDVVTSRAQAVDLKSRTRISTAAVQKLLESQGMKALPAPADVPAVSTVDGDFLLPSWDIVNGWDGKKGIPYYTANGLEVIDIDQYPHFSVLGMTGSRKSRGFLRPMIACALAAGHRVVIIGKSADYWPFESHVNATLLKVSQITKPEQAVKYATILSALVAEMNRRDEVLTAQRKSTWTHAGHCRTFVVLDELGNALRLMDRDMSNRSRLWVEGLVMEGRKVGFSIALANQRATGMASILSQTGKAIFRVESDEEKAHKSLMGASSLRDGYFLAKFGASKLAGAFEPTDDEIRSFLASRPVDKIEDDDWIDGQLVREDQVEAGSEAAALLPDNELGHADYLKVIDLIDAGKSPSAIVRELWGVTGGSKFLRLNEQVKHLFEGMKGANI